MGVKKIRIEFLLAFINENVPLGGPALSIEEDPFGTIGTLWC